MRRPKMEFHFVLSPNKGELSIISLNENDIQSGSEEHPITLEASRIENEIPNSGNTNWTCNYLNQRITSDDVKDDFKQLFMSFRCCICFNLAQEPINCKSCLTIFCKECAEHIAKERKSCPMRCAGTFKKEKINRKLKEIYDTILVKCPYGCEEYMSLEERYMHHRTCSEVKYICKNQGCHYKGRDIESHEEICEHKREACKFCLKSVKQKEMQNHIQKDCNDVIVVCTRCKKTMKKGEYISRHHSATNKNVACLRRQLINLKNILKSQKEEIENLKKINEQSNDFLGNKRKRD